MPKTFPYFPFYPDDFSSDAMVEAMSTTAVGCYALLLCKAWRETPPGTLPDNDWLLARWARCPINGDVCLCWDDLKREVLAAFTLGEDGRWHQKRMELEYQKMIFNSNKMSRVAKSKARIKQHPEHGKEHPCTAAVHKTHTTHSTAAVHKTGSVLGDTRARSEMEMEMEINKKEKQEKEKPPTPRKRGSAAYAAFFSSIPENINSEKFRNAWRDWIEHRKQKRKTITEAQAKKQLAALATWGEDKAIIAIENSIRNGWQGLFEPKPDQAGESDADGCMQPDPSKYGGYITLADDSQKKL